MNALVMGHRYWSHAIVEALASHVHGALIDAHQLVCGVRGHTLMLAFERHRILLRCDDCGYESTGWRIGPPALRAVQPARRPGVAPSPRLPRAA